MLVVPAFNQIQFADPTRNWSERELVAVANAHPPLFAPGTQWSYANTNYVVRGLVMEAVTGATLEQQLRTRLFEPLALGSTSFVPQVDTSGSLAHGFVESATLAGIPSGTVVDVTTALNGSWSWGAGAIVSDGDDVTKFFASLLGGRILPHDLLAAMKTVVLHSDYGLGLLRVRTACGPRTAISATSPGTGMSSTRRRTASASSTLW